MKHHEEELALELMYSEKKTTDYGRFHDTAPERTKATSAGNGTSYFSQFLQQKE